MQFLIDPSFCFVRRSHAGAIHKIRCQRSADECDQNCSFKTHFYSTLKRERHPSQMLGRDGISTGDRKQDRSEILEFSTVVLIYNFRDHPKFVSDAKAAACGFYPQLLIEVFQSLASPRVCHFVARRRYRTPGSGNGQFAKPL
jgi:hypothetical protein